MNPDLDTITRYVNKLERHPGAQPSREMTDGFAAALERIAPSRATGIAALSARRLELAPAALRAPAWHAAVVFALGALTTFLVSFHR